MNAETLPLITEAVKQTASIGIDWNEVILLAIGAAIGFFFSISTIAIQRFWDQKGKLNIFYRFINQKGTEKRGWGIEETQNYHLCLTIPVVFELQNTSNTTRVVRDLSLLLYRDVKLIGKMAQMDHLHTTTRKGNEVLKEKDYYYGAEKGSYSFVLPPRSIQKQECSYVYLISPTEKDEKMFNRIVARYYDEKNKPHFFAVKDICSSWEVKNYDTDKEWILLNNSLPYS